MRTFKMTFSKGLMAGLLTLVSICALAASQPATNVSINIKLNEFAKARCNNGGAATYDYILSQDIGAEDGVDYRKKWLVVLSGGGSCTNLKDCANRWNERNTGGYIHDDGPGDHFNMMPDLTARDFDTHGLLDFDGHPAQLTGNDVEVTANPFRGTNGRDGFNRVWINYCSSDSWQGTGTKVPLSKKQRKYFKETNFDESDVNLKELYFGGAKIVDAVIALIMQGQVESGGSKGTGNSDFIPDATHGEVVLAGSSAGGGGTVRNLDEVAYQVRQKVDGVKVWGIPDATSAANILPVKIEKGDNDMEAAKFYTNGRPALLRVDRDCFKDRKLNGQKTKDCYAKNTIVVRDEISTPYFVVQQAYDSVIHGSVKAMLVDIIKNKSEQWANFPLLSNAIAMFDDDPEQTAEAYIRFRMTKGADSFGSAKNNMAGLYIPNYNIGLHQLLTDSERFYTTPNRQWLNVQDSPDHPGSPQLGEQYDQTDVSLSTALTHFRECVLQYYGNATIFNTCVTRDHANDVTRDARVINTTAIPTP